MYLSVSADTTGKTAERNDLLLGDDVLQVGDGPVEVHFLDGLGSLTRVLRDGTKNYQSQLSGGLRDHSFFFGSRDGRL